MQKYKRLISRLIFFIFLLCIVLIPLLWQFNKTQNTANSNIQQLFKPEKLDPSSDNSDYIYVNTLADDTADNFYDKRRIVKGNKGNDNYYFDNKNYTIVEKKDCGNNDTIFAFTANSKNNEFVLPDNIENIMLSDWQQPVYSTMKGKLTRVYGHPTWIDLDYKQGNIPEIKQNKASKETYYAYYEDYRDSKRYYYRATCGAVTALNVYIRYYGKVITEFDFVKDLAINTAYIDKNILFFIIRAKIFDLLGLKSYKTKAQRHTNIEWSLGGTNTFTFPDILKYKKIPFKKMGIISELSAHQQLQIVGDKFKSGEIDQACLSINFDILYNSSKIPIDTLTVNHQIIITGAIYEIIDNKGKLTAFYVADSAGFLAEKKPDPQIYSLEALSASNDVLGSEIILINKADITNTTRNINVLGTTTNNITAGNSGNNILKALNGDDIYIIGIGNDKTIDIEGNDTYIIDTSSHNRYENTIIDSKDVYTKTRLGSIYVTKTNIGKLIDLTKDISAEKIMNALNKNQDVLFLLNGSDKMIADSIYEGVHKEYYFWNNTNNSELKIIYNNQIILIPSFTNGDLGINLHKK